MEMPDNDSGEALRRAAGYEAASAQQLFEIRPLAEMERIYIEMVINACDGNIPRASALLQVAPSTIYRKKAAWDQG